MTEAEAQSFWSSVILTEGQSNSDQYQNAEFKDDYHQVL